MYRECEYGQAIVHEEIKIRKDVESLELNDRKRGFVLAVVCTQEEKKMIDSASRL